MALNLSATESGLKALLENVYADEKVEAHEHMKLRRMSDEVLEKFLKLDGLSNDLKNMAQHADGFVEACTGIAKKVFTANIDLQKRVKAQQLANLELNEASPDGAPHEPLQDIDAMIVSLGEELIRTIEYQVAYIVIGTQQTAPKMRKDAVKII